ncbi:putative RNA methyltransferase [Zhihengliuella sp.]
MLACPVCRESLLCAEEPRRLICPTGHRYDAAKQGYFNLLTGRGTKFREDTAEMVAARASFQTAGHYEALAAQVAATVVRHLDPVGATDAEAVRIVDAGAGTGYYLDRVIGALESTATRRDHPEQRQGQEHCGSAVRVPPQLEVQAIALDISRYAMRRAARIRRTTALVCDLWQPLPLHDAGVDVLLNVFAPRNGAEYGRVVRPGGLVVVVTPLPHHLGEVRAVLGLLGIAEGKENAVAERLTGAFEECGSLTVETALELGADDAVDLAMMGPAGHHSDRAGIRARIDPAAAPFRTTAAFRVQAFRRR